MARRRAKRGSAEVRPFYEDDHVTLFCADIRTDGLRSELCGAAACVVTSPPYNVGLDYGDFQDALAWPVYRRPTRCR